MSDYIYIYNNKSSTYIEYGI